MDSLPPELDKFMENWPDEIHLVGGPYCGCVLHPHEEHVYGPSTERPELGPTILPTNFQPMATNVVVMFGDFGPAAHLMDSERRWVFRSDISAQVDV